MKKMQFQQRKDQHQHLHPSTLLSFVLTLAWASIVQKLLLIVIYISKNYLSQDKYIPHLMRYKTFDHLYCTGEFRKPAIKVNKDTLLEYEHLKQNYLFATIKRNTF